MKLTSNNCRRRRNQSGIFLKNYLTKYCPNVSLLGEAANIDEALVLIRNNELDLVFLDVEMPYGNAFDLTR